MIRIKNMILSRMMTNCYLVLNEDRKELVIIDPSADAEHIISNIDDMGYRVAGILLTHGHYDHIGAAQELRDHYKVKAYAHEAEEEVLEDSRLNLSAMFGHAISMKADILVKDGEELELAGCHFLVLHTPGHTQGGTSYFLKENGALLSGDTLFCESVGRSDFPTGSMSVLVRSVKERLLVLPEDTVVYPGHGSQTTIAHEAKYNPFL